MSKYRNNIYIFLAVFVGLIAFSVTSIVFAQSGDSNMIHACVRNNLPNLPNIRIVAADVNCNGNETSLDWPKTSNSGGSKFVVIDSQNQEVGPMITTGSVLLKIGNKWVEVAVNSSGFSQEFSVWVNYTSNDCSGTPYLPSDGITSHGTVIGNNVYFAGDQSINHYNSYRLFTPPDSYGDCSQDSVDTKIGSLESHELPTLVPPLTLR